ncbi:MAG TPA: type II toxin-antitoxin system VapC family toxin [Tepidisphaeraceae bacterium]|jgi:hypothetical protein
MSLDIPDGTVCFIDSNILYYALVSTPPVSEHCLAFLNRVIAGKISATVSVPVLSDTLHKVMMAEVAAITQRDRAGIVGYLGKHPEIITRLTEYPRAMDRLSTIPMNFLPLNQAFLHEAASLAVRHGLLTNDAIIVTLMQQHGLVHLATNDDDFDRVPGITIWKPR